MAEFVNRAGLMGLLTATETQKAIREMDGIEAYGFFLTVINDAPAADVADVVRCKDCENWQEHGVFHICERLSWIDLPGLCKDILFDTNPDSYCSFGRRINRPKEETEEQT